jgi:hypothetical protein
MDIPERDDLRLTRNRSILSQKRTAMRRWEGKNRFANCVWDVGVLDTRQDTALVWAIPGYLNCAVLGCWF